MLLVRALLWLALVQIHFLIRGKAKDQDVRGRQSSEASLPGWKRLGRYIAGLGAYEHLLLIGFVTSHLIHIFSCIAPIFAQVPKNYEQDKLSEVMN